MKKEYFICALFVFYGCKTQIKTLYKSSCILYGKPEVILKLNEDHTFTYTFRYNDNKTNGVWTKEQDTLFLEVYLPERSTDSISPIDKISTDDRYDKYLITGQKLYLVENNEIKKECFLEFK